jgi:protein-disulfide isomerase
MKLRVLVAAVAVLSLATFVASQSSNPASSSASPKAAPADLSPAAAADIGKRVETFLRKYYAWGPDYAVKVGMITTAAGGALFEVPVNVSMRGQSDTAMVYVTKDGRYMFRGDLSDLNIDPLAAVQSQLHLEGYASKGTANAKVTLVEFGDFQCPVCRQLDLLLRQMLPNYPQVRLVFKDFPLEQVHPWAMTAAIAGHCVLQKGSTEFWKFHDAVYDGQELITPENAYNKLTDLATAAGADPSAFRACMADPKTKEIVERSMEEGRSLQVNSTPTTFVDGRGVVGPDENLLKQYIDFDLK